jgi:hypothetical protein
MAAPAPPPSRLTDPPLFRRKESTYPPVAFQDHDDVLTTHFNQHLPLDPAMGDQQSQISHSPPPYMSPVDSPIHQPSTPHNPVLHSALYNALTDSDERRRNREWRQGKPVPFKGSTTHNDSPSDDHDTKKIEATLPKTEQTPSSRSRKASHYLRVFKDADATEEQKKRDTRPPKDRRPTDNALSALKEEANGEPVPPAGSLMQSAHPSSAVQSSHSVSAESYFDPSLLPHRETTLAPSPDAGGERCVMQDTEHKQKLPWPLLEEIRNFANITPGVLPGSSFSRSLPASVIDKLHAHASSARAAHGQEEGIDYFQTASRDGAEHSPASEEEESDREQISSALYFPHRQRKVTEQTPPEDQNRKVELEGVRMKDSLNAGKGPKGWTAGEAVQTPKEVEISLQSQDTNQCLHGDIQTTNTLQKENDNPLTSTVFDAASVESESEFESLAESTHSLLGNESSATDDLGTTPTATIHKPEQRAVPASAPQPPAPLGAVELKPFNHQVGGHSTVYRFSRRAVCKQLNNRENEFYETVERHHPELLDFLPRYGYTIEQWLH